MPVIAHKTMKFLVGNSIRFAQDSKELVGIPPSVEFVVEKLNPEMYRLTADGYGVMEKGPEAYDLGPLYVWDLTEDQRRLFDLFAIESQSDTLSFEKPL